MALDPAQLEQHDLVLQRYALKMTRDGEKARELVQDTYLKALKYGHSYDPAKSALRTWLITIMHRIYWNDRRIAGLRHKRGDIGALGIPHPDDDDQRLPEAVSPASQLAEIELAETTEALKTLPAEYKDILLRRGRKTLEEIFPPADVETYRRYKEYCDGLNPGRGGNRAEDKNLMRGINSLPRDQRKVVRLMAGQSMTAREAAARLGMKVSAARGLMKKARAYYERMDNSYLLPHLDRFHPSYRKIVAAAAGKRESAAETAARMGIPAARVRRALSEARGVVRKLEEGRLPRQKAAARNEALLANLDKLSPLQKRIVRAVAGEGLSAKDASRRLGKNEKAVGKELSKAALKIGWRSRNTETGARRAERAGFLLKHLEFATERQRAVILKTGKDGLSVEEAAAELDLLPKDVRNHLKAAESRVHKKLEKEEARRGESARGNNTGTGAGRPKTSFRAEDAAPMREEECRLLLGHPRLLTRRQRDVVEMIAGKNLTFREASDMTGINPGTLCVHWRKAVAVIRRLDDEQLLADLGGLTRAQQAIMKTLAPAP